MAYAYRHECSARVSIFCDRGAGKGAPGGKCRRCKSALTVQRGVYGVFSWTGTGRYPLEDAHATFLRESAAEKRATRDARHVVRWVVAAD